MPIRNHIAKKDTTYCGDSAPIKFKSIDEAVEYMESINQNQENDPCAKCLTIIANHCLDDLGYKRLEDWE